MTKKLIELALHCAQRLYRPETGFVHYTYGRDIDELHPTIPVLENLTVILALFRTRTGEHILEAIERLNRLLAFQTEEGFPTYLHEYPQVRDRYLCIHALYPLQLIARDFTQVIPQPSRDFLKKSIEQLMARVRLLVCKGALELKRQALLGVLTDPPAMRSVFDLGYCFQGLQLMGHPLSTQGWNTHLGLYTGAFLQHPEWKGNPMPTLYDYYMLAGGSPVPKRLELDHPIHLQLALIDEWQGVFEEGEKWIAQAHPHALRIRLNETFSLVSGPLHQIDENLVITYPKELPNEEGAELLFYSEYLKERKVQVNGEQATVFGLGDEVQIGEEVSFRLELEEGEGIFCGHISLSNRPTDWKKPQPYEARDWCFTLRTIERSEKLRLRFFCRRFDSEWRSCPFEFFKADPLLSEEAATLLSAR